METDHTIDMSNKSGCPVICNQRSATSAVYFCKANCNEKDGIWCCAETNDTNGLVNPVNTLDPRSAADCNDMKQTVITHTEKACPKYPGSVYIEVKPAHNYSNGCHRFREEDATYIF